ncbi:MAG: NAD(P)H-quinone oxidoreductase [Methylotenera sp.]|nr:NAD(P)H-quinone oxidoreductase [Oligoflexia bacterium]
MNEMMTVVTCSRPGGPEVLSLTRAEIPSPGKGEVLIRVFAAGVNRPDLAQRAGTYPPPPGASPTLGLEVSGEIVARGSEVNDFEVGDQVCALTPGGGYAEYCVTPAAQCLPVPAGLSLEEAAGIPENFFTVWSNVFDRGRLRPGESFLVHGGTSGIGLTAIQLAKAFGATVYTTAGSEEKCEACLKHGADAAIQYRTTDFTAEVKRLTQGQGVQLILDMVGGPYFQKNLDSLSSEGRLVQIAFLQGAQVPLSLSQIMSRRLTITGSTLRPRSIAEKAEIAGNLREKVWPLLEIRKVQVVIDRVFPLSEITEAHRHMESSAHIGKIILKLR